MRDTKQTIAGRRRHRMNLDRNLARAGAPSIRRVISAERRRVAKATRGADTPAAWEVAARGAVSTAAWVKVMVAIWTSTRLRIIWEEQQDLLGTDYPMPAAHRRLMIEYATAQGEAIAESRRDRLSRMVARDGE